MVQGFGTGDYFGRASVFCCHFFTIVAEVSGLAGSILLVAKFGMQWNDPIVGC